MIIPYYKLFFKFILTNLIKIKISRHSDLVKNGVIPLFLEDKLYGKTTNILAII